MELPNKPKRIATATNRLAFASSSRPVLQKSHKPKPLEQSLGRFLATTQSDAITDQCRCSFLEGLQPCHWPHKNQKRQNIDLPLRSFPTSQSQAQFELNSDERL